MKIALKENHRVVIEPDQSYWIRDLVELEEDKRKTCESIVDDIKRHVDEVQSVDIIFDERDVCEFCQREWEEYEEDYPEDDIKKGLPTCCKEAQEEWVKNDG